MSLEEIAEWVQSGDHIQVLNIRTREDPSARSCFGIIPERHTAEGRHPFTPQPRENREALEERLRQRVSR